jgi:hypothetical protein
MSEIVAKVVRKKRAVTSLQPQHRPLLVPPGTLLTNGGSGITRMSLG